MKKTSIIIAEDIELNAHGLELTINAMEDFEVIENVSNGRRLMEILVTRKPDIILLDINMPQMDGFDAAIAIRAQFPALKVIFLSVLWEERFRKFIAEHHLNGYLSKNVSADNLRQTLRQVRDGETVIIPPVGSIADIEGMPEYDSLRKHRLTPREKEVICLMVKGFNSEDIGIYLKMATDTVNRHRTHIYEKLDIQNAAELGAHAIRLGICQ